jgi:hypothetical protein
LVRSASSALAGSGGITRAADDLPADIDRSMLFSTLFRAAMQKSTQRDLARLFGSWVY